jgi:hypothetical protein
VSGSKYSSQTDRFRGVMLSRKKIPRVRIRREFRSKMTILLKGMLIEARDQ